MLCRNQKTGVVTIMRKLFTKAALAPLVLLSGMSTQAAVFELDPAESTVIFKWSYEGTPYQGEFKNVQASFDIDLTNPGGCNFSVTIPIADIAVDGAEVKDYLMDIEMFDVDQFPTASFQATKCSLQSVNSFTAEGSLTIRNQTHPLAFPFTLDIEMNDGQPRFHLTSEVTVKRLEFGVGQGYWANTSTIPNDVTIQVDVYAGQ
jgi:polyisoprenoid-binding protein YceI